MSAGDSSVWSTYVLIGARIPINSHLTSEADVGTGSPAAAALLASWMESPMKKAEAESRIRYLCTVWAEKKGYALDGSVDPSFIEFWIWLNDHGYGSVMDFRARGGPQYIANRIFDQVFKQTWKN